MAVEEGELLCRRNPLMPLLKHFGPWYMYLRLLVPTPPDP